MDLYKEYLKERSDVDLLIDPQGFVAFKCYQDRGEIFIVDLFVTREARGSHIYPQLMARLIDAHPWATHLTGTLFLDSQANANATLLAALKSGWKVVGATNNTIAIVREIKKCQD